MNDVNMCLFWCVTISVYMCCCGYATCFVHSSVSRAPERMYCFEKIPGGHEGGGGFTKTAVQMLGSSFICMFTLFHSHGNACAIMSALFFFREKGSEK